MKNFVKDFFCKLGFHKDIKTFIYKSPRDGDLHFEVYCTNCKKIFAKKDLGER